MKKRFIFLQVPVIIVFALFSVVNDANCQYSKVISFSKPYPGIQPRSMVIEGDYIYGTMAFGGAYNKGVLYKLNSKTKAYDALIDFDSISNGDWPTSMLLKDSYIYGSTKFGVCDTSTSIIYKIKKNGTDFEIIKSINPVKDSINNHEILLNLISDSIIYGMAKEYGTGSGLGGCIFKLKLDGSGFRKIFEFKDGINQGFNPQDLIMDGSTLYGITYEGGLNDNGIIYRLGVDGSGFLKLFDFNQNTSGQWPISITLEGNNIFGQASDASWSYNYVYSIDKTGTNFQILKTLPQWPEGKILCNNNTLYCFTSNEIFSLSLKDNTSTSIFSSDSIPGFYSPFVGPIVINDNLFAATIPVQSGDSMIYGGIYSFKLDPTSTVPVDTIHVIVYDTIRIRDTTHVIIFDTTTNCINGITSNDLSTEIKLYPNPFKSILYCQLNNMFENNTILHIYDSTGKEIYAQILNRDVEEINLNSIQIGFYTASISNKKTKQYFKILKTD